MIQDPLTELNLTASGPWPTTQHLLTELNFPYANQPMTHDPLTELTQEKIQNKAASP
jgi:hypothetical protein